MLPMPFNRAMASISALGRFFCGIRSWIALAVTLTLTGIFFALPPAHAYVTTIITPSNYTVANLQVGDRYYLDRTYTLTSVPGQLDQGNEEWIMTNNSDKKNTSESFLQFSISEDSIIYVAYDSRATALPSWLGSFSHTSMVIGVSEEMGHFSVYERSFAAGTIVLGGNRVPPASGASSNYVVIVQPLASQNPSQNVTIITPSNYTVADLQVGDRYYLDRTFTLTSIPGELAGGGEEWIMTRNDDKKNTSTSFLQFSISEASTVYVAYDSRATAYPSWLTTGFSSTSLTIGVSEVMGYFKVFKGSFSSGTVTLGGNRASPSSGAGSNYIVIVQAGAVSGPSISGKIFHDLSNNGSLDSGEPGLSNITVKLVGSGGIYVVQSDVSGTYFFGDLDAGIYTIDVDRSDPDLPTGVVLTTDNDPLSVSLGAGNSVVADFGFSRPGNEIFSDSFSDGNSSGWVPVDEGIVNSSWTVIGGAYHQTKVVGGKGSLIQSYHRGAFSYVSSLFSLTNYRFSAKVVPGSENPGNDLGVMFRYQDPTNYYRFSVNSSNGYSRLEKRVAGTFSTLAKNARGFRKGQTLNILVELMSSRIMVYLNNEPLFSVIDTDLANGSIALYCEGPAIFDDVYVETNNTRPAIVLSKPASHSVEISNVLSIRAVAINVPANGKVKFLLDGESQIEGTLYGGYFEGAFSGVSQGNHVIEAILTDGNGKELDRDTNDNVGVLGDSYFTVGNSITRGVGDNFSLDNISIYESMIAFNGYHAPLSDLFTTLEFFPNILFNEGVGGDRTADALGRVDSMKERHPNSNRVKLLLGTNDSFGTPGLPQSVYRDNMVEILNRVLGSPAVENVTVGLVPPAFGSSSSSPPFADPESASRNELIRNYNQEIRNICLGHPSITQGPDFYNFFIDKFSLFTDIVHPNALGHLVMSYLWFDVTGNFLPFILYDLIPSHPSDYPSTYKQNLLEEGNTYYIDRALILRSIPESLKYGVWIMTANDDKSIISEKHISFSLPQAATVYVGYDSRATSIPNWLRTFSNTGMRILTTDVDLVVYSKNYESGPVVLGGNRASGSSGAGSNYTVIVVPQ